MYPLPIVILSRIMFLYFSIFLPWLLELSVAAASVFNGLTPAQALDRVKALDSVSALTAEDVESMVRNQCWQAAMDAVRRGHLEDVDFSAPVRKAVREVKAQADELVRSLDPNYFKPQRVSPAFQWAQNDTSIFINMKLTRRWNAPGALEVAEPNVTFKNDGMWFTGVGEHSGKKFSYELYVDFFDYVDPALSRWSVASVGWNFLRNFI
jgi:hypothetical protein